MDKARIGIIGTGNIGSDLLMKIKKSSALECQIFAGHNPNSPNLKRAAGMGIRVSANGIGALLECQSEIDIIIDATSAQAHLAHADDLAGTGKYVINLTPTETGQRCVPVINGAEGVHCKEINMVTCAGQATIPLTYAIMQAGCRVSYIETVSTIASRSAGRATRENIDEFIEATAEATRLFTGVEHTKSIMVINPNEPPVDMRNTVYMRMEQGCIEEITMAVRRMEEQVRRYVPGYKVIVGPSIIDGILAFTVEVSGNGDFLPKYAGNLDIITCAAVEMAERYWKDVLTRRDGFEQIENI